MNASKLLNEVGLGGLGAIFGDMSIAEGEIKKAQTRHPEQADAIWNTFRSLQRPVVLTGKAVTLYQAHCAELLDRVASGGDVDFATKAEVVAVLSDATLRTRLRAPAEHLYQRLFSELGFSFGELEPYQYGSAWDTEEQNRVFSQIARRLDTKRR